MPYCLKCYRFAKYSTNNIPTFCVYHKTDDMWQVRSMCDICSKLAKYNYPKVGYPLTRCKKHALPNMINFDPNSCASCSEEATHGNPGQSPQYCHVHKLSGMVNVSNRLCRTCSNPAYFGYSDDIYPSYCIRHKYVGMINIITLRECIKCAKHSTHAHKSDGIKQYCESHAPTNSFKVSDNSIINHICIHPNCKFKRSANYPWISRKLYCAGHMKPGMCHIQHLSNMLKEGRGLRINSVYYDEKMILKLRQKDQKEYDILEAKIRKEQFVTREDRAMPLIIKLFDNFLEFLEKTQSDYVIKDECVQELGKRRYRGKGKKPKLVKRSKKKARK